MRRFIYAFLVIFLIGCGYKPVSKISENTLGDSVFVDVIMSKTDPQNTVAIKDAIRSGIVNRMNRKLAPKEVAKTYIIASIRSLSFSVLTYDQYGYATSYRANLSIDFKTKLENGDLLNITGTGDHDFRVTRVAKTKRDTSSVISDKDRYEAIQNASSQAFNEFIAALAVRSYKEQEKVNETK